MTTGYATEAAYKVYIDYLALGRHFTTNYDYHKFHGKIKAKPETFRTRRDVFFFNKLSTDPNWHEILLANMLKNPKIWIRDLLDESARETHMEWKKKIQSLSYTFSSDLSKLYPRLQDNFIVEDGGHPYLMTLYLRKEITLETITILTHITNVLDYWEKEIVDRFVSRDIIKLCRKYYPFLDIDKKKFSAIVKDKLELA